MRSAQELLQLISARAEAWGDYRTPDEFGAEWIGITPEGRLIVRGEIQAPDWDLTTRVRHWQDDELVQRMILQSAWRHDVETSDPGFLVIRDRESWGSADTWRTQSATVAEATLDTRREPRPAQEQLVKDWFGSIIKERLRSVSFNEDGLGGVHLQVDAAGQSQAQRLSESMRWTAGLSSISVFGSLTVNYQSAEEAKVVASHVIDAQNWITTGAKPDGLANCLTIDGRTPGKCRVDTVFKKRTDKLSNAIEALPAIAELVPANATVSVGLTLSGAPPVRLLIEEAIEVDTPGSDTWANYAVLVDRLYSAYPSLDEVHLILTGNDGIDSFLFRRSEWIFRAYYNSVAEADLTIESLPHSAVRYMHYRVNQ